MNLEIGRVAFVFKSEKFFKFSMRNNIIRAAFILIFGVFLRPKGVDNLVLGIIDAMTVSTFCFRLLDLFDTLEFSEILVDSGRNKIVVVCLIRLSSVTEERDGFSGT